MPFTCRARARSPGDQDNLQLPAGVQPGQALAIKQVKGADHDTLKQLAEHEEEVLNSLSGKAYVPTCYGLYPDVEAGPAEVAYCGNLVMG